jgi:predicted nucleic acid-binding protein
MHRAALPEMSFMNAVDTNILLYARDPHDLRKQAIARALLDSFSDGVLLWQVACEYIAASRKLAPTGFQIAEAWQDIRDLRKSWQTLLPEWSVQDGAERLQKKYSLSSWDAMIIAACLEGGVARLYSEDFDAYSQIEGLSLINPFKTP